MPYRLFDFSSDIGIEGEGSRPEAAIVELARAIAHVLTAGSNVGRSSARTIEIEMDEKWENTAVAFANEVIYLFDTEQFLVGAGTASVHRKRLRATLTGEIFNPKRHASGRGVKAATYHEAKYENLNGTHRFRVVLDL